MKPTKTITRSQYLQLLGLKTLADKHRAAMNDILNAMLDITDERDREGKRDDMGHTCDVVWSDEDLDKKLGYMGIEVLPPASRPDPTNTAS